MTYDRDHVYIRGRAILHTTAVRDWCCGICGGRLITRYFADIPNWRTVCFDHPEHPPSGFVTQSAWAHKEHRALMEQAVAADIFNHLPPEIQTAIKEAI